MYEPTTAMTELPDKLPIFIECKKHIAPILGISDKQARDLCREGQIKGAIKVGACWRVPRDTFLKQFGLA
jgi:hypothetical protein